MRAHRNLDRTVATMLCGATLAGASCLEEPAPEGELLLIVDTDAPIPELASRLRVDLYAMDGAWFDSREVSAGEPGAWPLSFSLTHPGGGRGPAEALVRLRLYPEGAERAYAGEAWTEPVPPAPVSVAESLEALCNNPPLLELGGTLTARRGRTPITTLEGSSSCAAWVHVTGSIAARVEIPEAGRYDFEVIDAGTPSPDALAESSPQVSLELRRVCADPSTAIDCDSGITSADPPFGLPHLSLELEPGSYVLVTGGASQNDGFADITLAAWSESVPRLSKLPAPAPPSDAPLSPLLQGDADATPAREPSPLRAIDRVFVVHIEPGVRQKSVVVLESGCFGRQAKLGDAPGAVVPSEAAGCVSDEKRWAGASESTPPQLAFDASVPPSRVGQAAHAASPEGCEAGDSDARVVCVPGGVMLAGATRSVVPLEIESPPRPLGLRRFFIDRHELTVGDFMAALDAGLALDERDLPVINDEAWPTTPDGALADGHAVCSWAGSASDELRRSLPLNCVNWYAAREICRFRGGDLPTVTQWEYATLRAGGERKRSYPWGEDPPACSCDGASEPCHEAVFGRRGPYADQCIAHGVTPEPVSALGDPNGDVSPLGIVGLLGNVREWLLDVPRPLSDPCWGANGFWDPRCDDETSPTRMMALGSYADFGLPSELRYYFGASFRLDSTGVRCVYEDRPF